MIRASLVHSQPKRLGLGIIDAGSLQIGHEALRGGNMAKIPGNIFISWMIEFPDGEATLKA